MANTTTCNYSGCLAKPKKLALGSYYCKQHYKLVTNNNKK